MANTAKRLICAFVLLIQLYSPVSSLQPQVSIESDGGLAVEKHVPFDDFCQGQQWCSSLTGVERLALEAIRHLHSQLDDDQNGSIDLKESDGFLREELQYAKGTASRQKNFHRNNDKQISVKNLWDIWVSSEVHNWTNQQTVYWISTHAELPQYSQLFTEKEINGTYLPMLASNTNHFLGRLGVRDPKHKQKLALKAQDVVLFGSPKDTSNVVKDVFLTSSLAIALAVIWVVYRRYQMSQSDLAQKKEELERLGKAADTLKQLQEELEKTKIDNFSSNGNGSHDSNFQDQSEELKRLKDEVEYLQERLKVTENEANDKVWMASPHLRQLLLVTYDLEKRAFSQKQAAATKQLSQAREACEKLREKRASLYRAFIPDNNRDMDRVDRAIAETTQSFNALQYEKKEMQQRWKEIEMLVHFSIISTSGTMHNNDGPRPLGTIGRSGSSGSNSARSSFRQPSVLNDSRESLHDDTRL